MQKLATEAQNKAKEEKKSIIHSDHIRAVSKVKITHEKEFYTYSDHIRAVSKVKITHEKE